MTEIFRPPYFQPDSVNGVPLAGALLYFYVAGTTTPITVYQDSGLVTPHASPVVADASGIFPAIYVNTATYKIQLQTSAGIVVKTYDNINTTSSSSSVLDGTFTIQNTADNTKQAQFNAANISTNTTRVFAFPDSSGTLLTTGSAATLAQALAGTSVAVVLAPNALGQERGLSNAPFFNLSLSASVAGSALTVAIKGADGNDPALANPVTINFRSATAGSGLTSSLTLTAVLSLTVSSGSTLGSTSAVATTYALAVFNDAGTARMAIINPTSLPLVDGIASATSEGGGGAADSAGVWYSSAAITSKAYTIIGFITATEATAGTWATAPSTVQVGSAPAANNQFPHSITLGTSVASTSGESIDFTGIPVGVSRVSVLLNGVSTTGSSGIIVQIGDSGGVEASGYVGTYTTTAATTLSGANSITSGYTITGTAGATAAYSGVITLTRLNAAGTVWLGTGMLSRDDTQSNFYFAMTKTLSPGPIDRVRLTTVGGTDTFDLGTVNISYEY